MSSPWKGEKEAAAYTGHAVSTFQKLRCYGGGCRYSKRGRLVRYHVDDLDAWMRSQMVHSTSEQKAA